MNPRKREMNYKTVMVATFRMNGQHMRMELTREDEEKDFQTDPNFPGEKLCLAANAYWALCTLAEAGKIENLDFYLATVWDEGETEEGD